MIRLLFVICTILLVAIGALKVCLTGDVWPNILPILEALCSGGMVGSAIYFFVSYIPERKRRKIIIKNTRESYKFIKEQICMSMIHASNKGGLNTVQANQDSLDRIQSVQGYRAVFAEGSEHNEGIHAFINGFEISSPEYEDILTYLSVLQDNLDVAMQLLWIDNQDDYAALFRVNQELQRIKHSQTGSHQRDQIVHFIQSVFGGYAFGVSVNRDYDLVEQLLRRL